MNYWWNNKKKLSKKELVSFGKNLTIATIFSFLLTGAFGLSSLFHPVISVWLITPTIVSTFFTFLLFLMLSSIKKEFYSRFCK